MNKNIVQPSNPMYLIINVLLIFLFVLLDAGKLTMSEVPHTDQESLYISRIEDNVFNRASGVIAINIAAGDRNRQANTVNIIRTKPSSVMDHAALQMTVASEQGSDTQESEHFNNIQTSVFVSDKAFHESTGVVQLNQLAGQENILNNHISIFNPSANSH